MPRCAGYKPDGTPCERIVSASQEYCYSHDESRKAERRKNASIAAKAKLGELGEIKEELRKLTDGVLSGRVEVKIANAACQVLNVRLRAVSEDRGEREFARRLKETEELEQRLTAIEEAQQNRGGRGWGS